MVPHADITFPNGIKIFIEVAFVGMESSSNRHSKKIIL